MSTLPYFKFYTNDWLVDTATLSPLAKGCYIDILAHTWSKRVCFEDNDKDMARLLRLTKGQWKKVKLELKPYFNLQNGTFFNKRLAKELQESEEKSNKNKENGSLGGQAKSLKNKETGLANATKKEAKKRTILELELELDKESAKPAYDWSELRGWLKEDLQEPFSVVIKLTRDFKPEVIQDAFDRIKKEETPALGKRVAYLRKRCKDRLAMGHSAPPSNKEDFTKLKVETRLKEISKAAGRDKATAVEEGYIRGEQWATDIIWPKEANA